MARNKPHRLVIKQVKQHEGLRTRPYRDTVGKLTIGYGHNLEDREMPLRAAEVLLVEDLRMTIAQVKKHLPIYMGLNLARKAVLVNMAYNLGIQGLLSFKKMRAALENRDWVTAANEMLDSRWAGQVGERATVLAEQMLSGFFPEDVDPV